MSASGNAIYGEGVSSWWIAGEAVIPRFRGGVYYHFYGAAIPVYFHGYRDDPIKEAR